MARIDLHTQQRLALTRSKDWLSHELRPLRGLRAQQALAVTRATAASRPPHPTSSCCHTSCGRFAASKHNKLLLSHELRPLRFPRTTGCCHKSCGHFAASAHNKLLLSHELRPLRGLRTQQALAVLSHKLRPLRGLRAQQSFAPTQALAVAQTTAAARPPHTSQTLTVLHQIQPTTVQLSSAGLTNRSTGQTSKMKK